MKISVLHTLLFVSFIFTACTVKAQDPDPYAPSNEGWLVKLDDAYAESKRTGKPIMANFTGSDWCGWCKKLTADVFSKPEFATWADKNVVLLELDFPRRRQLPSDLVQQNNSLQQSFQVRGYPSVWVFDLTKNAATNQYEIDAYGKTGYNPKVEDFISGVDQMIRQKNKKI